ncbi:MAG TPA: sensor histidine kinase [Lysobacter sp.]|jgi:two-component system sensor histidine kinase TctE|nr:sensor histidine kinase [Lysobacter sp.]
MLALLLSALLVVSAVELWYTWTDAVDTANSAYDRSLLGAIKSLDLNVSTEKGGLAVELPYRLFEFFQLTASGPVYFRVATVDGLIELGNTDLPAPPPAMKPGVPVFYDASYFGEQLRVGAYVRTLDRPLSHSSSQQLIIQVAETTQSRQQFIRNFVWRALLRDALVIATSAVAIFVLVTIVLRPITRLAAQVRVREVSDLSPLAERDLPSDVQPLVDAINQQLDRTQALVVRRRQFIDDASHQLRTPLATLRTQLDYALGEPDATQLPPTLNALSEQLDYATRSTNQLLAMARSDTAELHPEPFRLDELVREVAVQLLPLARNRSLDFGIQEPVAAIDAVGDRALLREALMNLADNAIRHCAERQEVTLISAADKLGYSVIVLDRGPGLDEQAARRLGQRFMRISPGAPGGMGLGLAIASTIVERHHGRLQLGNREDGLGTRASLWWPRAANDARRPPP